MAYVLEELLRQLLLLEAVIQHLLLQKLGMVRVGQKSVIYQLQDTHLEKAQGLVRLPFVLEGQLVRLHLLEQD